MLRALGALCVLLAAGAVGMAAVGRLRDRERTLGQLVDSLLFLDEELSFRLTPLPNLLEALSRRTEGEVGRFFAACLEGLRRAPGRGFQESWRRALGALTSLKEADREPLLALGSTLGRYDSEGQRAALRQAASRLERLTHDAGADRTRLSRVYAALSLAAGLMVVIVLM